MTSVSGFVDLYVFRARYHIRCANPGVLPDAVNPLLYHPCRGVLCLCEPDVARIPGLVVPNCALLWALYFARVDPRVIRGVACCEEDVVVIKEHCLDVVFRLPWLVPWPSWDKLKVMICFMSGCMRAQTLGLVFLNSLFRFGPRHVVTLSLSPLGLDHPSCPASGLSWR